MTRSSSISEDVRESIVQQTQDSFTIGIIQLVLSEVKSEKFDSRVLVLPAEGCRLYLFTNKAPAKLEQSIHYLEIQALESAKPNQLKINHGDGKVLYVTLQENKGTEMDDVMCHIAMSLKMLFPDVLLQRLIKKIEVMPEQRQRVILDKHKSTVSKESCPCGGFSRMYACMCDLMGYQLMDEVVWDLDTIYLLQDSRVLHLRDFDHLSSRDHVPLIAALQYNQWFTGVDVANMNLSAEAFEAVVKVFKKNTSIERWNLSNTLLKWDTVQKLSTVLISNTDSKIVSLDLSQNTIEDRGIIHLSGAIAKMQRGLQLLNVAGCSLTAKGINKLIEGFSQNAMLHNTLHTLVLARNNLKIDELTSLCTFIAQPNVIQALDLSETELALDTVFGALYRGCTHHLEELNLSGNPFSGKKTRDSPVPNSVKLFFASALVLKSVNLSNTKLPPQAVKELLLGISSNLNKPSVSINMSSNELRAEGGLILGSCIAELMNVEGLDLSDNGLDANLHELLPWFGRNGTIHHLAIGRNFAQLRNRALQQALDALVSAIQDENCGLESLSIADSKLRVDTTVIINALGSNSTLKSLDISGNLMGDIGAKMLAKAITINSTLTRIVWDRNNITAIGLRDIAQALKRNFSILDMPLPIFDIAACSKINTELIESSSIKIQSCLQRNHTPQKIDSDQSYRLQQGFLISSTQTIIDKLVRDIELAMVTLAENDQLESVNASKIQRLLSDADKAKQILVTLQNVATRCEEPPNAIHSCLQDIIQQLDDSVRVQMSQTIQDMLRAAENECPSVLAETDIHRDIKEGTAERSKFADGIVRLLVQKHLCVDLGSKLSYTNFNVANFIAETVIDKIVELLTQQLNALKKIQNCSASDSKESPEGFVIVLSRSTSHPSELPSPTSGGSHRLSVMNTLKRRPQSVLDRPCNMKDVDEEQSSEEAEACEQPSTGNSLTHDQRDRDGEDKDATLRHDFKEAFGEIDAKRASVAKSTVESTGVSDSKRTTVLNDVKEATVRSESKRVAGGIEFEETAVAGNSISLLDEVMTILESPSKEYKPAADQPSHSVDKGDNPPLALSPKPGVAPRPRFSKSSSSDTPRETDSFIAEDSVDISSKLGPVEPIFKESSGDAPVLKHLVKERPKRAKTRPATRPVPAADSTIDHQSVDEFFKSSSISQKPTIVTTSTSKTRSESTKSDKAEPSDSPKPKPHAVATAASTTVKDKQEADRKKGEKQSTVKVKRSSVKASIKDGIKDFFKGKSKSTKSMDTPDGKGDEEKEPPSKPERPSPVTNRVNAVKDIPEKEEVKKDDVKKDDVKRDSVKDSDIASANKPSIAEKSASLDRGTPPPAVKPAQSEKSSPPEARPHSDEADSKPEGEPVVRAPPKKVTGGVGLGMPPTNLLAEMKAKRESMQPTAAPKAVPRHTKEDPVAPPRPSALAAKAAATHDTPAEPVKEAAKLPTLRPKPPPPVLKPKPAARPVTMDVSQLSETAHPAANSDMLSKSMFGKIEERAEEEPSILKPTKSLTDIAQFEVEPKDKDQSTHMKDSEGEGESRALHRDSKRSSRGSHLANDTDSIEAASASTQNVHLQEGPILRPPPPKVEKRLSLGESQKKTLETNAPVVNVEEVLDDMDEEMTI